MKKHALNAILIALILTLGGIGMAWAEIIPPREPGQIGYSAEILCESLTLREQPDNGSKAIKTLQYGDMIIVFNQTEGWAQVALGDAIDSPTGWINSDYIIINPAHYRTEAKTPVYAWNDTAAPKVALLEENTTLPILKDDGDWLIVSLRGAAGWIQKGEGD